MLPVDFKTAILRKSVLLLLLWMCYVKSESMHMCPHGSYLHQNICYMPKFDLSTLTYGDALDNCADVNGTLLQGLNADSMLFLRRLHWKTLRSYWVGIVDTAIENKTKVSGLQRNKCIASVIYNGSLARKRLYCGYGVEYICEFQGSRLCGRSKMVGNKCYRLDHELLTYPSANDECRSKGGKLAEIKSVDEMRLIEEEIVIHDRAWESVSEIELNKINGQFPDIWLYSDTPDKLLCKTLKNWNSVSSSCNSFHPFICEIQGPHAVTSFKNETNHTNFLTFTNDASTITLSTEFNVAPDRLAPSNELIAPSLESTLPAEKLDYTLIVVVPVVACFVIALLVIILLVWFIRCAPNSKLRQSNVNIANRRKGSRGPVDGDGYLIALEQKENSRNLRDEGYQHIPVYDATVDDSHYETID